LLLLKYFVANYFISLKDVHVELFPQLSKLLGCDFKQWIDDYMTPKDEEYVSWVKKANAMRKGVSSSK
jgi:succinate dehydrogenase flavin-adding protein (antitoxin of CptAB toxin-antitoxin module)